MPEQFLRSTTISWPEPGIPKKDLAKNKYPVRIIFVPEENEIEAVAELPGEKLVVASIQLKGVEPESLEPEKISVHPNAADQGIEVEMLEALEEMKKKR